MPPCNNGNGTVRTLTVASFRYFQISIMLGSSQRTLYMKLLMICLTQILQQFLPVKLTVKLINLRDFNSQFFQIAFRKATHDIEFLQISFFFCLCKFKNHVNGLFLCITYKATGVNHSNLTFRTLGIMRHTKACFL